MEMKDTLPKLLKRNYEIWGNTRISMRHKDLGIWQEYTWKDYYENVKRFALGLKSLGFQHGDKICIIGDNEPEWYWAELASQSLQGIAIGIFVDSLPQEIKYIVDHSEAIFVVVRDQEQTDKVIQIRGEVPRIKKVIYWDPKGMWSYDDPFVMSFEQVQKLGSAYEEKNPGFFEKETEEGNGEDLAIISYTSGTTGLPKGAMTSHKNLITTVVSWFGLDPWHYTDKYLSYVPLAWIAEQIFGITGGLISGASINFPESPETVQNDIREIGPSMILYNSRMWEGLCSTIQTKIEDGSPIKRFLFNLFLPISYKIVDLKMSKKNLSTIWKALYWLGNAFVFRSLRDKIGLLHTRSPFTGGALISPGTFRFFRAVGVPLRTIYGTSEAGLCCCHFGDDVKSESMGRPLPGVGLKISEEGEILWKGDGVFLGYYKDPKKTGEVLIDGWWHSGDAGYLDDDGHIIYLDRMTDMRELEGGVKYPPQNIEARLKFSPYIKDVIALAGKGLPYVVALIQIDFESVGKWAERKHIAYTTFIDLSQKPEVYGLIENEIKILNRSLPEAIRVKKFVCLHKELDPDEGELTRTRKLRRDFLEKKYAEIIGGILENKESVVAKSEIRYRDGSIGETTILVRIKILS
jgi:long-chain acyl-CoA synthetase